MAVTAVGLSLRRPVKPAPAKPGFSTDARCEVIDIGWLEERREAWARLVAEAATPNPFYAPRIVTAHVAHGLADRNLRFVVAHRGERLLALVPFRAHGAWLGLGRRAHAGWVSPYVTASTPLIARDGLAEHVEILLDALCAEAPLWVLPLFSLDSEAGAALRAGLAARGWPSEILSAFGRPVLVGADEGACAPHIGAGRRKDIRRRRRRLAELGPIEVESFVCGEGLRQTVEDFLVLEAKGWKGAAGTALARRPATAAFLRAAFADDGGPVTGRADVMRLDGRPIAISLAFVCGGVAYLFKTSYDETLRRHAPGILLEDEIVRIRRETGFAERLDSASLPGSVLETLYPHREPIGDLLFATGSVPARALAALARQKVLRRRAAGHLKGLYRRLRAACQPTSAKGLASVEGK